MKIEPNMYVRTKYGEIARIDECKGKDKVYKNMEHYEADRMVTKFNNFILYKEDVSKASHNIIDLIEIGDYVNGIQVIDKEIDNLNGKYLQCGVGDYVICTYYSNEIEDVVTKEQFSQMEYKVGD